MPYYGEVDSKNSWKLIDTIFAVIIIFITILFIFILK